MIIHSDEKFADRLIELARGAPDHELSVSEGPDKLLDGRNVTDSSGANVQSRDPQTPETSPGVLARSGSLTDKVVGATAGEFLF